MPALHTHNSALDLVIGANSTIGSELVAKLSAQARPLVATNRGTLDLTDPPESWRLPKRIATAYLCAGVTSLEQCRQNPAATRGVNVAAKCDLARRLIEQGAFVVFLSTNLVFDGSEPFVKTTASPSPRTEYGRQKAHVEETLAHWPNQAAVVRLTKVVAPRGSIFGAWRNALAGGAAVRAFCDLPFSPIDLAFAARAILAIGDARQGGLWHVGGAGEVSYLEAAERIQRLIGAGTIVPASAAELAAYEGLPAHATLDASRLQQAFALAPPDAGTVIDSAH